MRLGGRLRIGRRRVAVKAVKRRVRANRRVVLSVKLPSRALRALARGRKVSAVFTLRATNAGGTRVVKRKVARLRRA